MQRTGDGEIGVAVHPGLTERHDLLDVALTIIPTVHNEGPAAGSGAAENMRLKSLSLREFNSLVQQMG
mgnify:CR=1 FL=1